MATADGLDSDGKRDLVKAVEAGHVLMSRAMIPTIVDEGEHPSLLTFIGKTCALAYVNSLMRGKFGALSSIGTRIDEAMSLVDTAMDIAPSKTHYDEIKGTLLDMRSSMTSTRSGVMRQDDSCDSSAVATEDEDVDEQEGPGEDEDEDEGEEDEDGSGSSANSASSVPMAQD